MTMSSLSFSEEAIALEGVLKLMDSEVWRWKNFPLNLPDPIIQGKGKRRRDS